ncbi:MAG: type II toxin-antitoxin system Phd/YefM family antitoxin [Saprospiraceae bacterium]
MIVANFSELRNSLKKYLDEVEDNQETFIVKRGTGKGTVIISLAEYNSIMETMYLLNSRKNADRIYESIQQIQKGHKVVKKLSDFK